MGTNISDIVTEGLQETNTFDNVLSMLRDQTVLPSSPKMLTREHYGEPLSSHMPQVRVLGIIKYAEDNFRPREKLGMHQLRRERPGADASCFSSPPSEPRLMIACYMSSRMEGQFVSVIGDLSLWHPDSPC